MSIHRLLPLAAAAALLAAPAAEALDWSSNAFRYRWGPSYTEPGVHDDGRAREIAKNIVSFTHVNGYKLGGNFFSVTYYKSSDADPSRGNPTDGATEFYAIYRTDLSANKVTRTKRFSYGPVRDLLLQTGVDFNTKNTQFGPQKVMPVLGPVIAFAIPNGFLNVGALLNKEWNNNGITGRTVEFDPTVLFTSAWSIPLGALPLSFEGFANANLPKGKDGFGRQTATEVLLHPKLMLDVGSFWGSKKHLQVGGGFEYWLNKFGNDHGLAAVTGAEQSTFFVEAAFFL